MIKKKIPDSAKKVHSWPSFDIYQREQELFDGTSTTFEIARMADSVKVILVDREQQKILMVHDEQPNLSRITFAWGLVETWESLLQTASREVQEEIGYNYTDIQSRFSLPYTHRVDGATYYYIASGLQHTATANPDKWSEKITLLEKTFDEFVQHICSAEHHSYFSYYIIIHYILPNKLDDLKLLLFGS